MANKYVWLVKNVSDKIQMMNGEEIFNKSFLLTI
jgi:hypothetical protein